MNKILTLVLVLGLTSCAGYEDLRTPFNFTGEGVNLTGSDADLTAANTYEVVVNAPIGTSEIIALQLFNQEAVRVCGSNNYEKQITSKGTSNVREFGVKGMEINSAGSMANAAPSIKGYVKCL